MGVARPERDGPHLPRGAPQQWSQQFAVRGEPFREAGRRRHRQPGHRRDPRADVRVSAGQPVEIALLRGPFQERGPRLRVGSRRCASGVPCAARCDAQRVKFDQEQSGQLRVQGLEQGGVAGFQYRFPLFPAQGLHGGQPPGQLFPPRAGDGAYGLGEPLRLVPLPRPFRLFRRRSTHRPPSHSAVNSLLPVVPKSRREPCDQPGHLRTRQQPTERETAASLTRTGAGGYELGRMRRFPGCGRVVAWRAVPYAPAS